MEAQKKKHVSRIDTIKILSVVFCHCFCNCGYFERFSVIVWPQRYFIIWIYMEAQKNCFANLISATAVVHMNYYDLL